MTANSDNSIAGGGPQEVPPPYIVKEGATDSPFLFAVPHSGRFYPERMRVRSILSEHDLRTSEDAYVDTLFKDITAAGGTLLIATHARAYLDLNRAANELDPAMFTPPLDEATVKETHRVRAGLGLVPGIVAEGMPIYKAPLPAREAFARLNSVYHPYHAKLTAILEAKRSRFGHAVLIDCHSMPSESSHRRRGKIGPDIVLGDNWGSACARELTSMMEEIAIRAGFAVRRNVPYSGGFTTQNYGAPNQGFHALQVEICRSLYMNEETLEQHAHFSDVRSRFQQVSSELIERFSRVITEGSRTLPKAAE